MPTKNEEMRFQVKLALYQVRVTVITSIGVSLAILGIGGAFAIQTAVVTLDTEQAQEGMAFIGLERISSTLLGLGIIGTAILVAGVIIYFLEGHRLIKEARTLDVQ